MNRVSHNGLSQSVCASWIEDAFFRLIKKKLNFSHKIKRNLVNWIDGIIVDSNKIFVFIEMEGKSKKFGKHILYAKIKN